MIVGVLATCHTQHIEIGVYVFLFNRTTLQVFVTYLTGALYFLSSKKIHIFLSQVYCVRQVVKTPTIISNNPVSQQGLLMILTTTSNVFTYTF